MLFDLLKGKQAYPLSYKIRSLSTDQTAFEVLPANRYYRRIGLHQTTVGISAAEVHIKHSLFTSFQPFNRELKEIFKDKLSL